jgi:hypothetical protein
MDARSIPSPGATERVPGPTGTGYAAIEIVFWIRDMARLKISINAK